MKVVIAEALGLCFGVRNALEAARRIEQPTEITVRGQLAHNPLVNRELADRGFIVAKEHEAAIPTTQGVLVTAHGISDRERAALVAAGKRIVDTTCPLVKQAHASAIELQRQGFHVLVIGQRNHVEVQGLTGDLASFDVLESSRDIQRWRHAKLGIIAQTTCPERDALAMVQRVRRMNPEAQVRFVNTICKPTRDRQVALEKLLDQVDVLVVVGGRNSNNTRRLVRRSLARHVPAIHFPFYSANKHPHSQNNAPQQNHPHL